MYDLIVIGGGAAGFFSAIRLAEERPSSRILILEKGKQTLAKVKVSGGGRCNVTHACFTPKEMIAHYPRGAKELLGPFHRFLCGDMMAWLDEHGVPTHIEDDGRTFPSSNSSQSIIDCFQGLCQKYDITIQTSEGVRDIEKGSAGFICCTDKKQYKARYIMVATGSSPAFWGKLEALGLPIISPVPSLFTFNIQHRLLKDLPGISLPHGLVRIPALKQEAAGPVLITHWGLSGPGILRLSAWAARALHKLNYSFEIEVDWTGAGQAHVLESLEEQRRDQGKRMVRKWPLYGLPKRLWERMCFLAKLRDKNYASLDRKEMNTLVHLLSNAKMLVEGKSTFKEEFVTCGGVERKEVDFKTMQSKSIPGLYLAGEVIDIDAITGGFNFQAAWTEAYIAAEHIAKTLSEA